MYGDTHLARLRQIADLLDRGYTLASIKELLEAWDAGTGLGGVLGLVARGRRAVVRREAGRITPRRADGTVRRAPRTRRPSPTPSALGVLETIPGSDDEFLVPSPQELAVAAELHAAGVPLPAITGHLRELRVQVEHIATRFLEFTTEHVFQRYPRTIRPPTPRRRRRPSLVRRLRPLAQQTIDAELARAMRMLATRYLRHHLSEALPAEAEPVARAGTAAKAVTKAEAVAEALTEAVVAAPGPVMDPRTATGPTAVPEAVLLPAEAVQAVRALVGAENTAAFIAAAAHREVQARTMDALAADGGGTASACGSQATSTGGSRKAPAADEAAGADTTHTEHQAGNEP